MQDLKSILQYKKDISDFFRKGEELNLDTILNDADIVIYSFDIKGEVTVRSHGKQWIKFSY